MRAKTESKTAASAPPAAHEGLPAGNPGGLPMPAQFSDGWQRQWSAGLKIMDLWLENVAKAGDAQLPAASEFVARAGAVEGNVRSHDRRKREAVGRSARAGAGQCARPDAVRQLNGGT